MKNRLLIVGLAAAATLVVVADLSAGWWKRCCDRYKTVIVCRPYNAFTPVCYGNLTCDGCCPAAPWSPPSMQPWGPPPMAWGDSCCSAGAPVFPGTPAMHPGPAFTPPPPTAAPGVTMNPMQPGLHPAAYQPYYPMPQYYPYPTMPTYPMMPAPVYPMPYAYGYPAYPR